MSLISSIETKLGPLVRKDKWRDQVNKAAKRVRLYRRYMDGDHRAGLTPEMKKMLRVDGDELDQFNSNYCELVVATEADRLTVQSFNPVTDNKEAATEWVNDLLAMNRFDALQMDVHEATLRDGDTYLMCDYDSEEETVRWAHELAFDGDVGVIVVYDRMWRKIEVAIKVWYEAGFGDNRRVNIYYPDRIEKYTAWDDGALTVMTNADGGAVVEPWLPGVVPIVHYKNRLRGSKEGGMSELDAVIPLQDALNRTLYSMVMVSELSAFQIKIARGFEPPQDLTPGMWVVISRYETGENGSEVAVPLEQGDIADASVLPQGQILPFIEQSSYLINQIATVSRTPLPATMGGDSQSGEALKQRETGLLSKIKKAQVIIGNAWEDALGLSAKVQNAYGGEQAPAVRLWSALWRDAQIRNDGDIINNALAVRDAVGEAEFLRLISQVFDYDDGKIRELLAESDNRERSRVIALASGLPGFNAGVERQLAG